MISREQDVMINAMEESALVDMTLSLLVSSSLQLGVTQEQCIAKLIECWEFHVNQ